MNQKLAKPRPLIFGCLLLAVVASAAGRPQPLNEPEPAQLETRCGWFVNPTPANIWLFDRDGEWTIGVQGGYQVEGDWDWPKFTARQWVRTNHNYGYGCACLQVRVDKEAGHVLEIKSSRARPLSTCQRDRSLKKWKDMLN